MEEKSNGKEYFEFKLDVLKIELEQIHDIVGRIDTITQATKNWTVAIWSGGIALALSSNDVELKKFIILTAVVPFLFWFIDANFRRRQRKFLYRNGKISDFLNSENLKKEISNQQNNLKLEKMAGNGKMKMYAFGNDQMTRCHHFRY